MLVSLKAVQKFTAEPIRRYLEEDSFHRNGVQLKSHTFNSLLDQYKILDSYTALYSPQVNAPEIVNRSVIAALKAKVDLKKCN